MLLQGWDAVAWPWSSSLGMANFPLTPALGHREFRAASEEGNLAGSSDLWSSNGPPFPSRYPSVQRCWFPRGNSGGFFPWEGVLGEPAAGRDGRAQSEFPIFRDSAWVQTGGTHRCPWASLLSPVPGGS